MPTGVRQQQHGGEHDGGQGRRELRAARVDRARRATGVGRGGRGVAVVDMSLLGWSARREAGRAGGRPRRRVPPASRPRPS